MSAFIKVDSPFKLPDIDSPNSLLLPETTTFAPRLDSFSAQDFPIPLVLPVTIATLFSKFIIYTSYKTNYIIFSNRVRINSSDSFIILSINS